MRRNLRLSILYDDWWVVNETRGLLRIFWKFSRKIVGSCRYWVCSTVSGPVPLWCGLLVSCQLHPLVPHHSRQRDHNPDQGTVIIRSWESWHIKKMGMIMICLSEVLKSIAGYFCLFCCWSWRGSTQCHHLISTMIWLRENDNKIVPQIGYRWSCTCTITEKAPTRAFSWLKAPTSAFTFKTLFIKTLC